MLRRRNVLLFMAYDEMELDMLGDQRTAMFVIISDTDDTFNFVVSILYTQLFNLLCDKADDEHGGRLPYHVRLLLDEFANIGQIPKFDKLIATIRSREISASIIHKGIDATLAIENIIFLLQKYIFDTDFEYFSWDYDDESEVTKNKWQAAKMVITIASKIVNRHELKPLVLTIMAQNYIVLGKWDKAIECYTAALNEYDSREDKNDIFNPPSSKDYTSEEQSAVLSIIHNIDIIYYLTGQNSKEYALSSKYARILQLEERATENFNREYPTMRGRVPSRCDFSNGMLYYEESFVEGIQTTNGISALQWLYIDKRMPIELSSNFLLMKSGNGISLHASYGEKKKTVDVYPKPSKISTVLKHQKALFQTLQIKSCLRSKTGKIDRWMRYIRSSI